MKVQQLGDEKLLVQELHSLLEKGAIEHVPLSESWYFIVPKKDGGCVRF